MAQSANPDLSRSVSGSARETVTFLLQLALLSWLTHALAYFLHEFGHSFTAWITGYKANPLALNYGHLSPRTCSFRSTSMRMSIMAPFSLRAKVLWHR